VDEFPIIDKPFRLPDLARRMLSLLHDLNLNHASPRLIGSRERYDRTLAYQRGDAIAKIVAMRRLQCLTPDKLKIRKLRTCVIMEKGYSENRRWCFLINHPLRDPQSGL
jgi:hypothetical protein